MSTYNGPYTVRPWKDDPADHKGGIVICNASGHPIATTQDATATTDLITKIEAASTPPTPAPPIGNTLWHADLSNGIGAANGAAGGGFSKVNAVPGHVTVVNDPTNVYGKVLQYAVGPNDNPPFDTDNEPRADLLTTPLFAEGSDLYVVMGFRAPPEQVNWLVDTAADDYGYLALNEVYGEPTSGSPSNGISIVGFREADSKNHWSMTMQVGTKNYEAWVGPAIDEAFHTFVVRLVLSADPAVGLVQLWFDGDLQTLCDNVPYPAPGYTTPTTELYYVTYGPHQNQGANWLDVMQYRINSDPKETVTTWALPPAVCTSYSAAAQYLASLKR